MEIYERIRHLRTNELNISQQRFGEILGVNRSAINNIERNALARPEQKEPLYKLICKTFNVREDWLKYGIDPIFGPTLEEDEYTAAMVDIEINDPKAKQAILNYWHLSDEDKKLFWKFADLLLRVQKTEG